MKFNHEAKGIGEFLGLTKEREQEAVDLTKEIFHEITDSDEVDTDSFQFTESFIERFKPTTVEEGIMAGYSCMVMNVYLEQLRKLSEGGVSYLKDIL